MIPHSKYKKELGEWGESCVDQWLNTQNWNVLKKNKKLYRGEIDRVYVKNIHSKLRYFCVSEIKTNICRNSTELYSYFTQIGLARLIKRNQIKTIYKYAEHLLALYQKDQTKCKIYVRFFIILKMKFNCEMQKFLLAQNIFKICNLQNNYVILSFIPEY